MNREYLIILCLFIAFFTSCQFSENIYINDDGSGKMEFSFDASEIMQMAGDEMVKDGEEAMDSTIVFKELFEEKKDSISELPLEEQERLKSLENFSMHMLMNPESKEMVFNLFANFKSVNELQDMFAAMNKMQSIGKSGIDENNPFGAFASNATDLNYQYDGKKFIRTAKIVDKELHNQSLDSLGEMAMMFASSKYKINYHFPKKIKSISNKEAMFSDDRKSFTIEYGFMEYLQNPESLNLEVDLED